MKKIFSKYTKRIILRRSYKKRIFHKTVRKYFINYAFFFKKFTLNFMTFLKYSIINYNFFFFKQFYNVFFFKKALHFYNNFFFKQNYNTLFFKLNKQHFLPSNNLTLMGLDDQKLFFFFKYFLYKNKFFFISRGIGTNIVLLQ